MKVCEGRQVNCSDLLSPGAHFLACGCLEMQEEWKNQAKEIMAPIAEHIENQIIRSIDK